MKTKEWAYQPAKGFFDLTDRPKTLSAKEHRKIQEMQMYFAEVNEKRDYYKKYHPVQWEKMKEAAAQLQMIVLQHWGDSVFK